MNRIFILAGTHEQARTLARWHDMAPNEWTYVPDAHKLRGQRQQTLWLFGSWISRADCQDVVALARAADFRIFTIEDIRYVGGAA